MDTIPYEILQLIAGNLLPRYQCRLAIVNKYHYNYLYTPLLQWHVRRSRIAVPEHRIIDNKAAICVYSNSLLIYRHTDGLVISNLTSNCVTFIEDWYDTRAPGTVIAKYNDVHVSYYMVLFGAKIFDHYYKYMHRIIFIENASIRASPLLSLPINVLEKIIDISHDRGLYAAHNFIGMVKSRHEW